MNDAARISGAVELGRRIGFVLLATADASGSPNLAAAGAIEKISENMLSVSSWFCPHTASNLQNNPRLSITVWDSAADEGYQILGTVEQVIETAVIDGYVPEDAQSTRHQAQTQREIRVRVEKVLSFSRAPYCDVIEENPDIS
ncbi:MAG TPA: pyridoxamine 5'-phosphate oxidase family protein [Deltaproteobacteria bacterium]|nr:pyridoxamine 5'-phosphate oxidase family protein [Deltaproteobacteria bacterium]